MHEPSTAAPSVSRHAAERSLPRNLLALAPLAVALLASLVLYIPALDSHFWGDDYLLLLGSRDMSWGAFLRSTWLPNADPGVLRLSDDYWRPLSFLTFRAIYAVFGDAPAAYHAFNLGVHLASIVLVFAVALRIAAGRVGAAVASLVFALHPNGIEAVTWAASINSAGLTVALGAWLTFANAVDAQERRARVRWLAATLALTLVALAFRETIAVVTVAMVLWFVLVIARTRLRDRTTWLLAGAPLLLLAFHQVVLSQVLNPGTGGELTVFDSGAVGHAWYYVRQGIFPTGLLEGRGMGWVQRLAAAALLAAPAIALWRREWLIAALALGFLVSIVPYAVFSAGHGPRYFYIPSALFALFAGAVAGRVAELLQPLPWGRIATAASAVVFAVYLLMSLQLGRDRVDDWMVNSPDAHERWIDGFQSQNPDLQDGVDIWVIDVPLPIRLFDGYAAEASIAWRYPNQTHRFHMTDSEHFPFVKPTLPPDTVVYTYDPKVAGP